MTHQLPVECKRFVSCRVNIKKPQEGHVIDISNLEVAGNDVVEKQGRELLQFFDILISQYPMSNP